MTVHPDKISGEIFCNNWPLGFKLPLSPWTLLEVCKSNQIRITVYVFGSDLILSMSDRILQLSKFQFVSIVFSLYYVPPKISNRII